MPYEGEFAQFRSIKRLTESERVKKLLGSYEICGASTEQRPLSSVLAPDIRPSGWLPKIILAVDGSHVEIPVRNGFPGAEASYVTVASVLVDLAKVHELGTARPVDPKEFRKTEKADSIDCALPGCNVIGEGDGSAKESLRHKVFEVFNDVRMIDDCETLAETYEVLLAHKPTASEEPDCPYNDCQLAGKKYKRDNGAYICTCANKKPLFSTDALRFHEGMNDFGTNGAMFAEIMQVLERVWIIHLLRMMESKGWLGILRNMAIVLDGPLAVFGHPAWLSQAIYQELKRLNQVAKPKIDNQDILLVGVEKSGMFVEHLNQLDTNKTGETGQYPTQTAALIDDDYIKKNIIFSDSKKQYGDQSYFGRKFFYKTRSGAKIVATLPFLTEAQSNLKVAGPDQYPRLSDAMSLLDQVVSSRYPNALTPLVSAHAEAAIPLNLGKRVLEQLARELMSEGNL